MKKVTKKYKVSVEHGKALLACSSMINTQGELVFDLVHDGGQNYVIIYNGKMDLFLRNIANMKRIFGGLGNKFKYNTPLPYSSEVTGDEFIF